MKTRTRVFHLGLVWNGEQIRAGVFDSEWRMAGKAECSAKSQRGLDAVLKRLARCGLDAVDDADLVPEDILAVGFLTNDRLPTGSGLVGEPAHRTWNADELNALAVLLPPRLGSCLVTGYHYSTLLWAISEFDLPRKPARALGLFADPVPSLFVMERSHSADRCMLHPEPSPNQPAWQRGCGLDPDVLVAAARTSQAQAVVLIGDSFEDGESPEVSEIRAVLRKAGLTLPVHVPALGRAAGVWAGARLAARTFGAEQVLSGSAAARCLITQAARAARRIAPVPAKPTRGSSPDRPATDASVA